MSWSLSVNEVKAAEIYRSLKVEFERVYPEPSEGVEAQVNSARDSAEGLAYSADLDGEVDTLYKVQASGHVSDDDAESFISVIVTRLKPKVEESVHAVTDDPAED